MHTIRHVGAVVPEPQQHAQGGDLHRLGPLDSVLNQPSTTCLDASSGSQLSFPRGCARAPHIPYGGSHYGDYDSSTY